MIQEAEWIFPAQNMKEVCPVFRRQFKLSKAVRQAKLLITALGVYEAYMNGERVGKNILAPGWTSYKTRLQVQEYNVTHLLQEQNELLITVGNGWFAGRISRGTYQSIAEGVRLIAQLEITGEDGLVQTISTGSDWESAESPIRFSDLYDGEIYDARTIVQGWKPCRVAQISKNMLIPQEAPIVMEHERLKPVKLIYTPSGETVIDFGQEITGYVSFSVNAHENDEICISHAEMLDAAGNFYTENLRSAKAQLRYLCREGEQTYKPHHTFMGFRYIRLDQFPGEPELSRFTAIAVHSELKRTGNILTSDPLLNRLFQNIIWSQKDNFLDIPTDCPQRDERLGWTGDAEVFIRTAAYNFDVEQFFRKWLRDVAAEQRKDGSICRVVPNVLHKPQDDDFCSGSAWGDAAVICPWQLYLAYGDKEILRESLPMMKKWVDYIRVQGDDEYLWNSGFQHGDWLGLDAKEGDYTGSSDPYLIATAYYAYSTQLLVKAIDVLEGDSTEYRDLYKNIVAAFRFQYQSFHTQTECALALHFGLANDPKKTAAQLAQLIHENDDRLTTGFIGTPYLLHALSENGYTELAYTLLLQEKFPSWLFSVRMGATTVWEHWDGRKKNGSFWSSNMNSFNHYAYGSVADWMYSVAAGIQIDEEEPAYRHIVLKPMPDPRLEHFEGSVLTRNGMVRSSWKWNGGEIHYDFDVPTEAEIWMNGTCRHVGQGHYSYTVKA
jgi:alpha-L-rhamnosidase